ncbi:hypothetical protein CEP51_009548 [Fusarium floridanum]|uniref:Uncharacterized protein n=1 Tax=Fusarium floridanum TaxID=1325733 RepID=A0A428RHB0_9HYPO|nr:hypothetical protein CEP51_009548 [Fusarium floridanum]
MADSGLLRFLGANKSRAHGLSSPRSEPALKDLANMGQRDADVQASPERPSMARITSWQGLTSAEQATPSASATEPPVIEPDDVDKLFINANQEVWHNPSMDQIAGALRAALMTNPSNQPLSAEYRPHVLYLLEGYSNIHYKIAKLERDLKNTKDVLEKQAQRHDTIEEHWMVQEARYKAEVKRLELVIHEASGKGLQAVALARAGSLIRNKPRALSQEVGPPGGDAADDRYPGSTPGGLQHKGSDEVSQNGLRSRPGTILTRKQTIDISNEVRLSRRFRRLDKLALKKRAEGTCRVDEESANHGETYEEQGRTEQPFRREPGSPSGTSSSDVGDEPPQEGKAKKKRHSAERRASHGAGIDGQPKAATQTSQNDKAAAHEPKNDDQRARVHRRQFSFVPGDDGAAVRLAGTMASQNTAVAQENPEQAASLLDEQPRPPLSTKPEVEIGRVDKSGRGPTAGH